ncbi:uncharacterized protein LOC126665186 [Mercurialis annua]|uniref:uncharacterized protein LOC126665186 n=1 Tax=Mercurialis annua TaxID=3986 RepID=UPI00215F9938|nr:uncharacterized protein LOC126665186 [Mercurialis annua]
MELNAKHWQFLWNLHIPPKLQIFIWRALSKDLPSGIALEEKTGQSFPCIHCGTAESIEHILFYCPMLVQMDSSKYSCTLFCFLLWHIWKARNEAIFKQSMLIPAIVSNWAVQASLEFAYCYKLLNVEEPILAKSSAIHNQWKPPPEGTLKINYDAASSAKGKFGTIGLIVSDYMGRIIARHTALVRHI